MRNLQLPATRADINERQVLIINNVKRDACGFVDVTARDSEFHAYCKVTGNDLPTLHAAHCVGCIKLLQASVLILPVAGASFPELRASFGEIVCQERCWLRRPIRSTLEFRER